MAQSEELRNQYDLKFEPNSYLEAFYSDEAKFADDYFLKNLQDAFESGGVTGERILDFSSGPIPHRLGLASKYCKELTYSDFSSQNRKCIEEFLSSEDLSPIHQTLFQALAKLEGFQNVEDGCKAVVKRTKSKVTGVVRCDANNPSPLEPPQPPFDIVHSSAVIEAACLDTQSYVVAVKNIASLVKPGGYFICSGYTGGHYYQFGKERFPCLNYEVALVEKSFAEAGFRVIEMKSYKPEVMRSTNNHTNCTGLFFAIALKPE